MQLFHKDHGAHVATAHGIPRSDRWPTARRDHLKIEPQCVACTQKNAIMQAIHRAVGNVEVHHIIPFHIVVKLGYPGLELDQRNLITLGANCGHHILLGHLDDYRSFNADVREHAEKLFFGKSADEIKQDASWLAFKQYRPKDLGEMSDAELEGIRSMIMQKYANAA